MTKRKCDGLILYLMIWLIGLAEIGFAQSPEHSIKITAFDQVIITDLKHSSGHLEFLLATNSPFALVAENVSDSIDLSIKSTSHDDEAFGSNANTFDMTISCYNSGNQQKVLIFNSDMRTAKNKGDIRSQSVKVNIDHVQKITPVYWVGPVSQLHELHPDAKKICLSDTELSYSVAGVENK